MSIHQRSFDLYDVCEARYLLLRLSTRNVQTENVDLIFLGVRYMEMPSNLHEPRITKPRDEEVIKYESTFARELLIERCDGDLVYRIESKGERYHVIASGLWVQVNTLPDGESSLTPLCEGDEDEKRAYYGQYVKDWYKLDWIVKSRSRLTGSP